MLKSYLKRLLRSPAFWAGAVVYGIILLFSPLYYDIETNSMKTIFYCITSVSPETLYSDVSFSFENALCQSHSGWAVMFAPVFVSVGAVSIYIDERESRFKRFVIFRKGTAKYILSNFAFFVISAGIICMLGSMVFTSVIYYSLPNYSEYADMNISMFCETNTVCGFMIEKMGVAGIFISTAMENFIFGAMMIMPSFMLCSFVRNKYLSICVPFFITYSLTGISSFFAGEFLATGKEDYNKLSILTNPNMFLFSLTDSVYSKKILIIALILSVFSVLFFGVITKRQVDKGA